MLENLLEKSIKKRGWVVLGFLLISIAAFYSLKTLKVDAIPDIGENQQIVFTNWPGRSPKDVEAQVTYPLSVQMQGLPGVKNIRGISGFGFSSIYIIFNDDIDYYWSRSRVLEKISTLEGLPSDARPSLGPDATGLGQVFWYTLENDPGATKIHSLAELRSLQDFYVRYQLQSVSGVSEVSSIGGFIKEYQIDMDPRKIFAYDIHFSAVIKAIQDSNIDVGAEVIEEGDREYVVRGKGFFNSIDDIGNVVVAIKNRTPIRVKDLATIKIGPAFRRGALDKNGSEVVGGVVTMRFGENPKEVLDKVKEHLEVVKKGLPKGVSLKPFYDRTEVIEKSLHTVKTALVEEIVITIVVIGLFLLHLPSSFLVSLTLPFGVGISFILMKVIGIESNVMSLAGLVIAIGSMVDMGIIMVESIYGEILEDESNNISDRLGSIIKGARFVAPAIVVAVSTTIITFLPVFGLQGSEGKLFHPLAWSKTLAMAGSVAVAIFLIPALSAFLLKGKLPSIEKNKMTLFLQKNYQRTLRKILKLGRGYLLIPLMIILIGVFSWSRLGSEFMPSLNEGDILYMPVTTPDVSMTKARELLSYTDSVIKEHPLVEMVVGKLGRVDSALDPAPVAMFETVIRLVPQDQWPRGMDIYDIMNELDAKLQVPGLVNSWDFPIQTRIGMISTGIKSQVGLKVFGDDPEILEKLAAQAGKIIEGVPGARNIYSEKITGKPYIEFKIDRVAASRYGINTGDINKILQTAVGGMTIGQFFEGRERYPIRVRYKKEFRDRIDELKKVLVPGPLGDHIPLHQLADIKIVTGPSVLNSEAGKLRFSVLFNGDGQDIIGLVQKAKAAVEKELTLPKGYTLTWEGQFKNQQRAQRRLMILIPLALLINILLMRWGLKSWFASLMVFSAIPLSLSGGLITLWLFNIETSVAVWVGFIALFGIAVDDGVVMMTNLQGLNLQAFKNLTELKDGVVTAAVKRIRPLVMTTVTTLMALLPVLWASSVGSEVIKPMALPILGGMIFELMSLLLLPYLFFHHSKKQFKEF
ncbi:MAG: CusA/CzcA family heavy metal efflux RND transporter [Bacteriovoracaceae bacterium]|nr:CusA/CzcA family heavy metal efflux RND transporter [Bacteriovoracaceae bacterium]